MTLRRSGTGIFAELGWRWRRVNNSPLAHLVPPDPGKGSRTACNALPVNSAEQLTMPMSFVTDIPQCARCKKIER